LKKQVYTDRTLFENMKREASWKAKVQIGILPLVSIMFNRTYCHHIGGSVYCELLPALFSELQTDWGGGWLDGKEEDK
jgi:hypothetical protein